MTVQNAFATRIRRCATAVVAAALVTGGSLTAAAAPAHAAYYWGAIAFDTTNGFTTAVIDYPSSSAAASAVMGACGSHCGYQTFVNTCAAIAFTSNRSYYNVVYGYTNANDAAGAAVRGLPYAGYLANWACTTR